MSLSAYLELQLHRPQFALAGFALLYKSSCQGKVSKSSETLLGYGNVVASTSSMGEQPAGHAKHSAGDLEMLQVSDFCTCLRYVRCPDGMVFSACRPGMQYHVDVLMEGTLRVASALLDQPMQSPDSTAESSRGGAARQPEQAAASQAPAIAPGGASQTLLVLSLTSAHLFFLLHVMALCCLMRSHEALRTWILRMSTLCSSSSESL